MRRIVAVLKRLPRPTLRRLTKVTSTPAHIALVGGFLMTIHSGQMDVEELSGAPDPAVAGTHDPAAQMRRAMEEQDRRTQEELARSRARRERNNRQFDHRSALMRAMTIIGLVPVAAGLGALGLGLLGLAVPALGTLWMSTFTVVAVTGIVALLVLVGMAIGGDRSVDGDQRDLRSNTAGGMLVFLGLVHFAVAIWPAGLGLTEPEWRTVSILCAVQMVLGIVVSLGGAVQREGARKRAGLPKENPTVIIP